MRCDTPMTLKEAKEMLGIVDRQPIPMTNEEYLKSCNTEQLADKLTDFSFWLVPTIPTEDKREQIRKKIELWLKEKHK